MDKCKWKYAAAAFCMKSWNTSHSTSQMFLLLKGLFFVGGGFGLGFFGWLVSFVFFRKAVFSWLFHILFSG